MNKYVCIDFVLNNARLFCKTTFEMKIDSLSKQFLSTIIFQMEDYSADPNSAM